jgi:hypothetical protein
VRRASKLGTAGGLALLLAACGYGVTGEATDVGHSSATLTGTADRTEPGGIVYWFEYGETTEYGSTTPTQTAEVTDVIPVEADVDGLEPSSTYHYRLCVEDVEDAEGSCGADRSFTTTAADEVTGNAFVPGPNVGIVIDARSDADGANATGTASIYLPDPGGFRFGTVTCLRVVGNRATVGYDANSSAYPDALIYVEEAAGGMSRFDVAYVGAPPTTCPAPPTGDFGLLANTSTIQVTDVP